MSESKDLPFSRQEYETRLTRLWETMEQNRIDVLLLHTPENIYYLTGYHTTGYYVYQTLVVPVNQTPTFVVRKLERGNVSRYSWVDTCLTFADDDDPALRTVEILADLGFSASRIGLEETSWFLTASTWRALGAALPGATIVDASGYVEALRLVKSPAEIEYLRQAGTITSRAVAVGLAAVRPGVSENSIAAEVYRAALVNGSEYMASPVYVSSGPRTGTAHATWGGREVQSGDVVLFELAANVRRYSAATMRTAVVTPVEDQVRALASASQAGRDAAIRAIRPGATSGEIDHACRRAIEEAGAGMHFHHRTGYSIGIGFPPGWGEGHIFDLKPNDPRPLQAGMTLHVVPQLVVDSAISVGISACVLVTDAGCELLVDYPPDLAVVDGLSA